MIEKYLVIHPSGKLEWAELERKPRNDGIFNGEETLNMDDVRKIIGCEWLEQVHTNVPDVVMLIDETGKIQQKPKPHNELAFRLYNGWNPIPMDDIVGIAVLFGLRPTEPLGELDLFPLSFTQLVRVCEKMGIQEIIFEDEEVSDNG